MFGGVVQGNRLNPVIFILGIAAILPACADQEPVRPNPSIAQAPVLLKAVGTPETWTRFSADIIISYSGGPMEALQAPGGIREMKFHVDRYKQADGAWSSTVTLPSRKSPIPGTVDPRIQTDPIVNDIRRVEIDGSTNIRRSFTASGKRVDKDPREALQRYAGRSWKTPDGRTVNVNDFLAEPKQTPAGKEKKKGSFNTSWITGLIAEVGKRDTRIKKIEEYYGKSMGSVNGQERYVHSIADTTSEVLLDPRIGSVVEANHTFGGKSLMHVVHGYIPLNDSTYFRATTKQESIFGNMKKPVVMEIKFNNIRIE